MLAICLHVSQVVEAIDGARNQAERCEYNQRRPEEIWLQQFVAEEYRRKHEEVLEPLQRSKQLYVVYHSDAKVAYFCETSKQLASFLPITSHIIFILKAQPPLVLQLKANRITIEGYSHYD